MEKMIKVINDNLRNVINGIKEHRIDLEATLGSIKNEMSLRVKEASTYKSDVENARTIISSLENEIADLEKDLLELNDKFGSKNFKEILNAGNKEINAKIVEKRALINEQGQIILALTDKARGLKDILIELREKKITTEENLEKTRILEGYFENRIGEAIRYSEEHPDELASFRDEIPQEELNTQENIDISSIIDGSIFEEIDEISSGEPDAKLLESVLANPEDIPVYEQPEEVEEVVPVDVSTANQLENMISEAKSFIEKQAPLIMQEPEIVEQAENKNTTTEEIVSDIEGHEQEDESEESDESPVIDHNGAELEDNDDDSSYIDIYVDDEDNDLGEYQEKASDDAVDPDTLASVKAVQEEYNNMEDMGDDPFLDIAGLENELGVGDSLSDLLSNDEDEEAIDLQIEEDNLPVVDTFDSNIDIREEIKNCGLDIAMMNDADLMLLEATFDKNRIMNSLDVIRKHNISIDNVYKNVQVLTAVTPENLDNMLSLLERTDANTADIELVFRYLDNANVSRLEQVIMSGNMDFTSALSQAINYNGDEVIGSVLGISSGVASALKRNASEEDYRIMNTLPDVVLANYRELKDFHIENLDDCISKYPHRFALAHSKFHEILDKYDTEDLVRCIHKNPAVIDKL